MEIKMNELTILLVDKAFLGFVVGGVGYFFAGQLEHKKKKLALLQELSKRRAESISNVFGKILQYESKVETLLEIASCDNRRRNADVKAHADILDSTHESVTKEADSNRFLLGEDLYEQSKQLSKLISVQLHQTLCGDIDGLKKSKQSIANITKNVQQILPSL